MWSCKKAPVVSEAWGRRKPRVSPTRGQPKLPLGAPGLRRSGRKWRNTAATRATKATSNNTAITIASSRRCTEE